MFSAYEKLKMEFRKVGILDNITSILGWDSEVNLPTKSVQSRVDQINLIEESIRNIITSDAVGELIEESKNLSLDDYDQANLDLMSRRRKHMTAVPLDLSKALSKATIECEMIWRQAKANNDFSLLRPLLQKVLDLTREMARVKSEVFQCSKYDALLDTYDQGITVSMVDNIFSRLELFLPPFIQEALEIQKRKGWNLEGLKFSMEIENQVKLAIDIIQAFGFDFERGRVDVSSHPFCGGNSQDIRITSRYNKENFMSGIGAIIHETGHALYEKGLPRKRLYQESGNALGMATHESQSLLLERYIGSSREFIHFLLNTAKNKFNTFHSNTPEQLYKFINKVQPSLIRIYADEVTYPVHIILRYKLEKAMIEGQLALDDLQDAWNENMINLLGIKASTYTEGCLQDIHWNCGAFGYFPHYVLGSIIASQYFAVISSQFSNMSNMIKNGDFLKITEWLRNNIHNYGSQYNTIDLLKRVTGNEIDVNSYIDYLRNKFILDA